MRGERDAEDVDVGPPDGFDLTRALAQIVLGALAGLLTLSIVGLPAGILGFFLPVPIIPLVVIGTVAILRWLPPVRRASGQSGDGTGHKFASSVAGLAILLALTASALNAVFATEHIVANRDPGVYVATAQRLATTGNLFGEGLQGPFASYRETLDIAGFGFYANADESRLSVQFMHLLPEVMALGTWLLGADGLFLVNPMLGGLALLSLYLFATRFVRPIFALVATSGLATNLVFIHFARDAYTEILAQVFFFGGLWALTEGNDRQSSRWSWFGGALLGASCVVRIDAIILLIPLTLLLLAMGVGHRRWGRQESLKKFVIPSLLGMTALVSIAAIDGLVVSMPYVRDLRHLLLPIVGLLVVIMVSGIALMIRPPAVALDAVRRFVLDHRRKLAVSAAVILSLGIAYGWILRPGLEVARELPGSPLIAGLQAREGVAIDQARTYAESSIVRLSAYMGGVGLLLGFLGFVLAVWRWILGRAPAIGPFLGVFGAVTFVYLWRPSIFPDQIWSLRRFLPITIPGLLVLAVWFAQFLWRSRLRHIAVVRAVTLVALIGMLIQPALVSVPVMGLKSYAPGHRLLENFCRSVGPNTAAVVLPSGGGERSLPQMVQSFCGWPVAVGGVAVEWNEYRKIASAWNEEGRQLVLVGSRGSAIPEDVPGFETSLAIRAGLPHLERTIERVPRDREDYVLELYVTYVEPTS